MVAQYSSRPGAGLRLGGVPFSLRDARIMRTPVAGVVRKPNGGKHPCGQRGRTRRSRVRFGGWRSVPERLKTIAQWKRQGRSVMAAARKTPAAVVGWDGSQAKVYSEDQTRPYNPRPATVAFREDCQAFTAFLNPRQDRHAFKPRKDFQHPDWPQTTDCLTDDLLERAFSHREGLAVLPSPGTDTATTSSTSTAPTPPATPDGSWPRSPPSMTSWSRRATASSSHAASGTSRGCTFGSSAARNCRWPSCWRRRTASRPS